MNRLLQDRCSRRVFVLAMGAAMLLLVHPGAGAQAPGPTPQAGTARAGNVENGKKLYISYGCSQCHNYVAQGGGAGPRLAPRPIPFAAFVSYSRQPTGQMPPYTSKVVSDSEWANIYAFVQSIPEPPPAKSIPILND